jgi:hypothetical protein
MSAGMTSFKVSQTTSAATTVARGGSGFSWYDTLSVPEDPFFASIVDTVAREAQEMPAANREAFESLLSLAAKPKKSR